mgnify:CR=1 FL=1
MKIGLSYSRCVRDIVDGAVDINPPEDEGKFRQISIELWETGKLHQPRKFGAHPSRLPYYWLDTFAPEDETRNNPVVQEAWDKYKTLAGLVGN